MSTYRVPVTILSGALEAGMDEAAIRSAPDARLVGPATAARFDPAAYRCLPDPLPAWHREAA